MDNTTLEDKLQFVVYLNKGVTLKTIKKILNRENIQTLNYFKNLNTILCQIEPVLYATLFQIPLELDPSKAWQPGYTSHGYKALESEKIPNSLKKMVASVHLNLGVEHIGKVR